MPPERCLRPPGRALLILVALAAAGCSTWVDVRPLATSRADVEAFELRGPELVMLRREVLRRCPQGAEVLRQAARDQQAAADNDGRITRWMNRAAGWVDPPQREAQMMVVCRPNLQGTALVAAKAADEDPASGRAAQAGLADSTSAEAPPIGPITPQW